MKPPNSDSKSSWLEELQLKSWEPEILLSGIVLYGMFQVPDILDRFLLYFGREIYNGVNAMDALVAILKVGVYWLIGGLILHLICRGVWVGMVGLSYAFPSGIDLDKLKFQPKYLAKVADVPSFEEMILKLERFCSFIYSVAFLLFMSLVGIYIYATVLITIPMITVLGVVGSEYLNDDVFNWLNRYSEWVLYFGFIGVLDFLTMGYFRRFKVIATIFWPLYRLFNFLTLANYYRPTYYAIVTNLNRWWLFLFLLVFACLSFMGIAVFANSNPADAFSRIEVWSSQKGNKAYEGYYQDKNLSKPSELIQVPSDIIRDDVLRVFIPLSIGMEDSLQKFMNYDSISTVKNDSLNLGRYYLKSLGEFYSLSIADSTFKTKGYFQDASSTNQRGFITYLNIGHLHEGLYELQLKGPKEMFKEPFAIVPFYKVD